MKYGNFIRALGMLVLALWSTAAAAEAPEVAVRAEFRSAWDRTSTAIPPSAAAAGDSPALRSYVLYPYLVARRLEQSLGDGASDAAVEAYLVAHGDSLPARSLRLKWLFALARRGQWPVFQRWYRGESEASLACYALQARQALRPEDPQLAADSIQRYLSGDELPGACDPVFDALRRSGRLTPELVAQRAQLALAKGNAKLGRFLAGQLSDPAAVTELQQWADYLDRPGDSIKAFVAAPDASYRREAMLEGWSRLTRKDPQAALPLMEPLAHRVAVADPQQAADTVGQLRLSLALGLSWSRRPEALAQYRQVADALLDTRAQEWRVRAALWAGDWAYALQALDHMDPTLALQKRWRYWRARTLAAQGQETASQTLYRELALERDYYSYLAADALGQPYRLQQQSLTGNALLRQQLLVNAAIERGLELLQVGLRDLAAAEWRQALNEGPRATRIEAALLASSYDWYEESIALLAQADEWHDLDLRYPLPYRREIEQAAKLAGLPPEWIYAVARQESLFRPDAVSGANALGLMQLLLPTAQPIARRWQWPLPGREDLFRPEINLPLGAEYLRGLIDRKNGRWILALASYNAGPNAADNWLPERRMDTDVWIENIPYNETRSYVQRILEHTVAFAWRRGSDPLPRLSSLMEAQLPPRGPAP